MWRSWKAAPLDKAIVEGRTCESSAPFQAQPLGQCILPQSLPGPCILPRSDPAQYDDVHLMSPRVVELLAKASGLASAQYSAAAARRAHPIVGWHLVTSPKRSRANDRPYHRSPSPSAVCLPGPTCSAIRVWPTAWAWSGSAPSRVFLLRHVLLRPDGRSDCHFPQCPVTQRCGPEHKVEPAFARRVGLM